jgi:hypothetical protein
MFSRHVKQKRDQCINNSLPKLAIKINTHSPRPHTPEPTNKHSHNMTDKIIMRGLPIFPLFQESKK